MACVRAGAAVADMSFSSIWGLFSEAVRLHRLSVVVVE